MEKREFIENILRQSGELVLASFGEILPSQKKLEKSQIVTEVDIASERRIIEAITKEFPKSGIIAEESGFIPSQDNTFFVIDPIDGTSNFANALPWFGVMIAFLQDSKIIASGIYLPVTDEMYSAEKGKGAFKNGKKIKNTRHMILSESLVSFCFSSDEPQHAERDSSIVRNLGPKVLNLRTTNSAYDYAYAVEGKLAATINFLNKLWDIASVILLANESSSHVSEVDGLEHIFDLTEQGYAKNYTLLISNTSVIDELQPLLVS